MSLLMHALILMVVYQISVNKEAAGDRDSQINMDETLIQQDSVGSCLIAVNRRVVAVWDDTLLTAAELPFHTILLIRLMLIKY